MAERQPSWDKYEAAILLEGILASMKGELTRSDAVKAVSHDLRAMAVHRGIEIDAVYRNTNGISFQMKSMESAYLGRTVFKPATRLFTGVASLYHDSHDEYQKLLKEARAMIIDGKTVKDDFMRYLAEQVSPAQLSDFYICYSEIETFCLKIKVLQKPLFQTTDIETIKKVQRTIEQNKFFRITRRKQINKIVAAGRYYYNYIKEGLYSRIGIEETAVEESNTATQTFQPQHTHNIANDTMSKSVASEQSDEINSRSFSRYLSETLKMADATSRSYSSAINNCEVFAREHQLPSWQLYTSDRQAAQETIRLLLNDADFLSYNARQHKLRYELRYVSSSDFDSTIKQLRNTEEKYANKIVAVVCFAKDDAESVVLGKKIHDALAAGTYNMIFIDASRTPFGADGYGVYRHDMALSMSQQGKDPALVTQYANNAKDSLKKWKTRIAGGEFMVHTADKPDGERATTLDALYGLLAEINKKKFVSCLEGSYNVIANMYTPSSLKQGVECAFNEKTAGTFLSGSPATKLEIALDGAWKVPEYWLSKPHLLISKIKLCVDEIVNDGFQNGGGRVSIKQIYDVLKAAPYGFMPCNLSAFIMGFVLKEYASGTYSWSDGLTNHCRKQ